MLLFYSLPRKDNQMNKTIKNTIVFTNGDSVIINESISLPLKEKVMYKIKNSEKNIIQEKRSDVKETSIKGKTKASETTKPSEGKVIHNNEENASERKKKASKKTEKENKPKQQKESKRFQKRTHGGITFEVEVINGRDYFNGKEIHCDNSGFYHPYATMKDIMKWTKEHLKKNSYTSKKKIGRD